MEKDTLILNRKIASFTKSVEVNGDIIVPDIKPDILSIINTDGNCYIYKEDISDEKIRVDGNIDTYTVYLSDSGENRSIVSTHNFSESFELEKKYNKVSIKTKVNIERIDSKVLNERKVSQRINIILIVDVYSNEEIDLGVYNFDSDTSIQKLEEKIYAQNFIGSNFVKTSVKEDIIVDNSLEIAEILNTNIEIDNIENKISFNKVLSKADCNIKILFLAEDGKISCTKSIIPVMSFIDLEGVKEDHECIVNYIIRNMSFNINSSQDHSIACHIDFEVALEVFEKKEINVIQDMYGIKKKINFENIKVEVPVCDVSLENEKVNIFEKISVQNIEEIHDIKHKIKIANINLANIECEYYIQMYYGESNGKNLNCKEVKIPFLVKNNIENGDLNLDFKVINEKFTISDENVDYSAEIICQTNKRTFKEISIIKNVQFEENYEESEYKMYMYFAKKDDTIWDIAKKFCISKNELMKLNNLNDSYKINVGDILYIKK